MLTPRPYQREAIDALRNYWNTESGNALIVAPTGSGKSFILALLIQELIQSKSDIRILVLTHCKELLEQSENELLGLWSDAPCGVFSAGLGRREIQAQILFAGIQSIENKLDKLQPKPDIIIVDEAHLIPRNENTRYKKVLDTLQKRVVGLTATPYRLDSGWLHLGKDKLFDKIVFDISVQKLIDDGYLSNIITKGSKYKIDTAKVGHLGKEFRQNELEDAAMEGDLTALAVADMCDRAKDRKKWLIFAVGIKHAQQISDELLKHNITNAVITGETPTNGRDSIIDIYKNGGLFEYRALVNVNVLTTGFNCPQIDMIAMLRPTESCGLYVQMIGRGMRRSPAKENCLILDYAGNICRHGPIDMVNPQYSESKGDGVPPCRECPECFSIIHAAVKVCPFCGYVFPRIEIQINNKPDEAPILKEQIEPTESEVLITTYSVHKGKNGKPDSVRIDYLTGNVGRVSEWVFPEASNKYYFNKFCVALGIIPPFPRTAQEFIFNSRYQKQVEKITTIPDGKFTRVLLRIYKQEARQYEHEEIPF